MGASLARWIFVSDTSPLDESVRLGANGVKPILGVDEFLAFNNAGDSGGGPALRTSSINIPFNCYSPNTDNSNQVLSPRVRG